MMVTFDSKTLDGNDQSFLYKEAPDPATDLKIKQVGPGNYEMEDLHGRKRPKRSKNGCLTCKIRKKKCGERRPVCLDCERLHKECVWIDRATMSEEYIREIRKKLEEEESGLKLRKRKSKFEKENETPLSLEKSQEEMPETTIRKEPAQETVKRIRTEEYAQRQDQDHDKILIDLNKKKDDAIPTTHQITPPQPFTITEEVEPKSKSASVELSPLYASLLKEDQLLAHSPPHHEQSPQALFYNFLKGFKYQHHLQLLETDLKKVTALDENGQEIEKSQLHQLVAGLKQGYDRSSPSFNPLSPQEMYYQLESHYPSPNFDQLLNTFSSIVLPEIPKSPSLLPQLDSSELFLYNYYAETLSDKISIAPSSQNDSNCYQQVFLPLAHQDKGVLYGILAWACFHLGGNWKKQGNKYIDLILDHMSNLQTNLKSSKTDDAFGETTFDRNSAVLKIATLLILCGAEISRGDVKKWSVYLTWCWKVLSSNGGILNFNQTREENWLISNFAYHDLLATSVSNRGTYFPSAQYDVIFEDISAFSRGRLNPLLGVCKKLYKIIGEISSLVFESKRALHEYFVREGTNAEDLDDFSSPTNISTSPVATIEEYVLETDSQLSFHTKRSRMLSNIIDRAKKLESDIDSAKPSTVDLMDLTDDELELQLTVFEIFQLVGKLFIRQAVMKINPSSLESQVLVNDLTKCLDITLGTPVQASLVFPVFIAGIHCVTRTDKMMMRTRIDSFIESYGTTNVDRVKALIEKVWEENPTGSNVVDWYLILKNLDWEVNFA